MLTEKPNIGDKLIYQQGIHYAPPRPFTVIEPPNSSKTPFSDRIIGMLFEDGTTDIINWISGDGVINPLLRKA